MNTRTITHNDQLDQLIGALQPKAEKPAPLSATWPVLHERAMEAMKVANANPWVEEPPSDMGFFTLTILAFIFVAYLLNRRSI